MQGLFLMPTDKFPLESSNTISNLKLKLTNTIVMAAFPLLLEFSKT